MGVRVESSFARDSGVLGSLVELLYLSFEVININYLLYFSELALLSAFFYLLESKCSGRAWKLYPFSLD